MGDPALGTVEGAGCFLPGWDDALYPIGEWTDGLRESALLRWPVVHLEVDVQMIVSIPGGLDRLRPQSLQIRRKCPRAGAGEE